MKRLVLLGEGKGEVSALPILIDKLLKERAGSEKTLCLDREVVRKLPSKLVQWNKTENRADYSEWIRCLRIALSRGNVGGVLAVYDGDADKFPAGSPCDFCPSDAAKKMAAAAAPAGAGQIFSLSVVFAYSEYETWLVAGAESLAGKAFGNGPIIVPKNVTILSDNHESRGKGWFKRHCGSTYRETRDQAALTKLLDLKCVRSKNVRSFIRLEHAIDQLLDGVAKNSHFCSP